MLDFRKPFVVYFIGVFIFLSPILLIDFIDTIQQAFTIGMIGFGIMIFGLWVTRTESSKQSVRKIS